MDKPEETGESREEARELLGKMTDEQQEAMVDFFQGLYAQKIKEWQARPENDGRPVSFPEVSKEFLVELKKFTDEMKPGAGG